MSIEGKFFMKNSKVFGQVLIALGFVIAFLGGGWNFFNSFVNYSFFVNKNDKADVIWFIITLLFSTGIYICVGLVFRSLGRKLTCPSEREDCSAINSIHIPAGGQLDLEADSGITILNFFGWVLIVIGFMIALFSGGCTLLFFLDNRTNVFDPNAIGLLLLFGGIPFVLGMGIRSLGLRLVRPKKRNDDASINCSAVKAVETQTD